VAPDALRVACAALGVAILSAALAGWAPVQFSIATVFLFAGPHNWIEARYFLARLPGRWGRSRPFFALSIGGAVALAASYAALPAAARALTLGDDGWAAAVAAWNTAVVLWIVAVGQIHARQTRRDWSWMVPVGFALVAVVWAAPYRSSLALVYLHPLVSLWFLDRELRRRPAWRSGYRLFLACLPLIVAALWLRLSGAAPIPGDDGLTLRITEHAGASLLPGVSSRLLVATHTFLEAVHYGVWVVAMPLVGFRTSVWRFEAIPLARRSSRWSAAVRAALLVGAAAVVALWACFVGDYATTRDVYFTLAMLHVLVEAPFLVRLL
jgi:hypothetical protein